MIQEFYKPNANEIIFDLKFENFTALHLSSLGIFNRGFLDNLPWDARKRLVKQIFSFCQLSNDHFQILEIYNDDVATDNNEYLVDNFNVKTFELSTNKDIDRQAWNGLNRRHKLIVKDTNVSHHLLTHLRHIKEFQIDIDSLDCHRDPCLTIRTNYNITSQRFRSAPIIRHVDGSNAFRERSVKIYSTQYQISSEDEKKFRQTLAEQYQMSLDDETVVQIDKSFN